MVGRWPVLFDLFGAKAVFPGAKLLLVSGKVTHKHLTPPRMLAPPRMLVANEGFFRHLRHQTCRADRWWSTGILGGGHAHKYTKTYKNQDIFLGFIKGPGVRSGGKMFEINTFNTGWYNRKTTTYFIRRYSSHPLIEPFFGSKEHYVPGPWLVRGGRFALGGAGENSRLAVGRYEL